MSQGSSAVRPTNGLYLYLLLYLKEFDSNETMCVINLRDFHNYYLYIHNVELKLLLKLMVLSEVTSVWLYVILH